MQVIQETLRSASILSFTFREAVEDVEFQGYVIPKGWKVLPLFRTIHHSSDFFPHPHKFDPSRFEVLLIITYMILIYILNYVTVRVYNVCEQRFLKWSRLECTLLISDSVQCLRAKILSILLNLKYKVVNLLIILIL